MSEKGCGVIFITGNLAITPNKWNKEKSHCSTACSKKNLGTSSTMRRLPLRPGEAQLAAAL